MTVDEVAAEVCSRSTDMELRAYVDAEHGAIWTCEITVDRSVGMREAFTSAVLVEEKPTAEEAANEAYTEWLRWKEENDW